MGAAKSFFDNKDVDKRIKSQVYVSGTLNALLWGCESWNLSKDNLRKLSAFHHGAIRRIIGKIVRANETTYPKKFLAAWINNSKKPGAPQLTCNNNFANALRKIVPNNILLSEQAPLYQWTSLAKEESTWTHYINEYFESCRNANYEDEESPSSASDIF